MSSLQKLPAGNPIFGEIREKGYLYVDKTRYIPDLISIPNKIVFCSRPRRFGKSLTVSTLESFYAGRKDLFRGLDVEAFMNSKDFQPRPVIRLDMSEVAGVKNDEELKNNLRGMLSVIAKVHGVQLFGGGVTIGFAFNQFLKDIHAATGKQIVLLIDEYDAPVIKSIGKPQLLEDVREVMSGFYTQIKAASEHIHFAFITGVSKFSGMGVFSTLNNISDISLDEKYASFMGITHEEMRANFGPFIARTAEKFGVTPPELEQRMEEYYNGFSFDGETRVYNPFSALMFLNKQKFSNFWIQSGSNEVIREFLKGKKLDTEEFRNMSAGGSFAESPGPVESTSPAGFLYQAGYLTLRKIGKDKLVLDYPNFEVYSALSQIFVQLQFSEEHKAREMFDNVRDAFRAKGIPALVKEINMWYGALCQKAHQQADERGFGEAFYQSHLRALFLASGIYVEQEKPNSHGFVDIVAKLDEVVMVIELKHARESKDVQKMARVGMDQIHKRDYSNAYSAPVLLALAVDGGKREIGAWLCEDCAPEEDEDDGNGIKP